MPFLQPDSPFATPAPFYPVHVPQGKRAAAKPDKTKAHDKARRTARTDRASAYSACAEQAPHCAHALARMAGKAQGADYGPGIMAELAAMPEGLAFALSAWAAPRCRRTWVDADGMRRSAPATPYSELPSALPRVVWHLATSPRQASKPLSGTHGAARRRSNWDAQGNVRDLSVLLRGALSNLRRQDKRNGGEAFKRWTSDRKKAMTAAIQAGREAEARDRRTVAEHRISLREQRLALRASVSPTLLPALIDACASGEAKSNAVTIALCRIRASAKELATP